VGSEQALILGIKYLVPMIGAHAFSDSQGALKGNKDASIKVVEFLDFECPACAQGAIYLKKFIKTNPELISLEVKHFPLRMVENADLLSQKTQPSLELCHIMDRLR